MKPKVALVSGLENSATEKVMNPLLPYLRESFDITTFYDEQTQNFEEYDLVHTFYLGYLLSEVDTILTSNVWQIGPNVHRYKQWLTRLNPEYLVVDDPFTKMQLGQLGFCNTTLIPLTTPLPSKILPFPEKFTIGCFGNDYLSKRFKVIRAAAKLANIPLSDFSMDMNRTSYELDVEEVFKSMSVIGHASFHDTGSLVVLEALKYGRPAVATWSPGLARTLRSGENGEWFDGSVEDLASKLLKIKGDFARYCSYAAKTEVPPVNEIADSYKKLFLNALGDTGNA